MPRQHTRKGRPYLPGEEALRSAVLRLGVAVAALWRRRLDRTTFIGVTGSAGKTTTKTLIVAILGPGTVATPRGSNRLARAAKLVLRTRRSDAFCVVEVAAWRTGSVEAIAQLIRPQIAVVTRIGRDHHKAFRTLEGVAAEKSALVAALPDDGIAVLNADDPHAIGMAAGFAGRVISFGSAADATLRTENIRSSWPDPLEFTLAADGRSLPVRTRLHGKHTATSVLAALGAAHAAGIPLEHAVATVAGFQPVPARMSPVVVGGITFIRDDNKAPAWSFDVVLDWVGEARAARKIVVVGTISDYPGSSSKVYERVARRALAVADEVVFVGSQSGHVRKLVPDSNGALSTFATVREAAEHFAADLRDGDLVVLKGSNRADHLFRILLARTTGVECWLEACHRQVFCDACELLHQPG